MKDCIYSEYQQLEVMVKTNKVSVKRMLTKFLWVMRLRQTF